MPSTARHLAQARSDQRAIKALIITGDHLNWQVTISFYVALHWFEAFCGAACGTSQDIPPRHDTHFARHETMRALVDKGLFDVDTALYPHYRALEDISRDARYNCQKISQTQAQECLEDHMPAVESWVTTQLAKLGYNGKV